MQEGQELERSHQLLIQITQQLALDGQALLAGRHRFLDLTSIHELERVLFVPLGFRESSRPLRLALRMAAGEAEPGHDDEPGCQREGLTPTADDQT